MGKRHLTPAEIKDQCKRIARESRMADRTPWTAIPDNSNSARLSQDLCQCVISKNRRCLAREQTVGTCKA